MGFEDIVHSAAPGGNVTPVNLFAPISRAREAGGAIETDPLEPPTSF
jgi:hypothetical protein